MSSEPFQAQRDMLAADGYPFAVYTDEQTLTLGMWLQEREMRYSFLVVTGENTVGHVVAFKEHHHAIEFKMRFG